MTRIGDICGVNYVTGKIKDENQEKERVEDYAGESFVGYSYITQSDVWEIAPWKHCTADRSININSVGDMLLYIARE